MSFLAGVITYRNNNVLKILSTYLINLKRTHLLVTLGLVGKQAIDSFPQTDMNSIDINVKTNTSTLISEI